MGSNRSGSALLLFFFLLPGPSPLRQSPETGGRPVGFRTWLWPAGGPARDRRFAEALRRIGISGTCVDNEQDPAPVAALGIPFYLDHAAGKGVLHLRAPDFDRVRKAYEAERDPALLKRPHSLLSPKVRVDLKRRIRERVERARKHGPAWISIEDEISTTRFTNPIDFDFSPQALQAFRSWMRRRYGSAEALRRIWPGRVPDFEDLVPRTTDEVRRREFPKGPWPRNLADWNDHLRFQDQILAELVGDLLDLCRELAPGIPAGFEGGQPPSAFGGYDWRLLLAEADAVEVYDIGGARELVRSWKKEGCLHFETLFPVEGGGGQDLAVARLYDMLAHGLDGAVVWSAGRVFAGTDPSELTVFGKALAKELPRLRNPRVRALAGARVDPGRIGILESQESVRLHWMLDSRRDGRTWIRRFGSHERKHSTSQSLRLSWIRLLQDLGYAFRFVHPSELSPRRFDRRRLPKVLILPGSLALSGETIAGIRRFATLGGLVLADETPARYDEYLRLRERPALDEWFGIERSEGRRFLCGGRIEEGAPRLPSGLALVESGLRPEGLTRAEWVGKNGFSFVRPRGEGRSVLLDLDLASYHRERLREDRAAACRELRARMRRLLEAHEVLPVALVRVPGYPTVLEKVSLRAGSRRFLVIRANVCEDPTLFTRLVAMGSRKATLWIPSAATVRELFSGEVLGRGRKISFRFDPVRGTFLELERL